MSHCGRFSSGCSMCRVQMLSAECRRYSSIQDALPHLRQRPAAPSSSVHVCCSGKGQHLVGDQPQSSGCRVLVACRDGQGQSVAGVGGWAVASGGDGRLAGPGFKPKARRAPASWRSPWCLFGGLVVHSSSSMLLSTACAGAATGPGCTALLRRLRSRGADQGLWPFFVPCLQQGGGVEPLGCADRFSIAQFAV